MIRDFLPFTLMRRKGKRRIFSRRYTRERLGYKVTHDMITRYRDVVYRRRYLRFRVENINKERRDLAWRMA